MNRTQEYRSLTTHNQIKPSIPVHEIPPHTWQSLHQRIKELHNQPNISELQGIKTELHSLSKRVAALDAPTKFHGDVKRTLEIFVVEMMIDVNALLKKCNDKDRDGRERDNSKDGDGNSRDNSKNRDGNSSSDNTDSNNIKDIKDNTSSNINKDNSSTTDRITRPKIINKQPYDVLLHEQPTKTTRTTTSNQLHKMQETTSTIKRQNYAMLNTQITEIGQLMSDISMHINIQGENLKRIDEVIERVDDNLFGGFREIEKVWNSVKGRRKSIGVFVAVWIVLILLYVLFRSI